MSSTTDRPRLRMFPSRNSKLKRELWKVRLVENRLLLWSPSKRKQPNQSWTSCYPKKQNDGMQKRAGSLGLSNRNTRKADGDGTDHGEYLWTDTFKKPRTTRALSWDNDRDNVDKNAIDTWSRLQAYLEMRNSLDLLPVLRRHGVRSLEDLEYKVEPDYYAMGFPLKRAQVFVNDVSFRRTPVSQRILSAGLGDDYCRKLYKNEYYSLEEATGLNEVVLKEMEIPEEVHGIILKLFNKDLKYSVVVDSSYSDAQGAASLLNYKLKNVFKKDEVLNDLSTLQNPEKMREYIPHSKSMLILLSKEHVVSPHGIFNMVLAHESNMPTCSCVVEKGFNEAVFSNITSVWENLKPVGKLTGQEFLRRQGIGFQQVKVAMENLQKRKQLRFDVDASSDVQNAQVKAIVEAVRECHVEYASNQTH